MKYFAILILFCQLFPFVKVPQNNDVNVTNIASVSNVDNAVNITNLVSVTNILDVVSVVNTSNSTSATLGGIKLAHRDAPDRSAPIP